MTEKVGGHVSSGKPVASGEMWGAWFYVLEIVGFNNLPPEKCEISRMPHVLILLQGHGFFVKWKGS